MRAAYTSIEPLQCQHEPNLIIPPSLGGNFAHYEPWRAFGQNCCDERLTVRCKTCARSHQVKDRDESIQYGIAIVAVIEVAPTASRIKGCKRSLNVKSPVFALAGFRSGVAGGRDDLIPSSASLRSA